MTRFDATDPESRQALVADAIRAHRERESPFCTIELAPLADDEGPPPWVQYADGTLNLDCTDAELDRLHDCLDDYPAFRVDALEQPDDAPGTNVRIGARADAERVGEVVEAVFREVYEAPEDVRAWGARV